ncbi:tetratricopeptide repeat (TPR)-like superfamily protein [Artemisia annua]|uniref:Tetratricopeptide repeat (TPR)-like superfamily protein n=1 Tax=Artemisia annua TaxID=35608 RepID=A0A2U1N493_ARTAN|nr:tetratricopeptide repeat (TPR)-like superfamily protein [Artemisia annua]
MPQRNEATWNTMISVLSRVGLYSDAFVLFGRMRDQGFEMSGFVIASLLTGCAGSGDMVDQGVQVHGLILKNGLLCNVYAGTALLNFYTKYGFYDSARGLFDEMPEKNVVSWTSLMVGYGDNGNFEEVVKLYRRMKCEDVDLKCGYEYDLSVANSLISMFGNLGRVKDACYVFDGISWRDTISWNSMISAYARNNVYEDAFCCFNLMRRVHEKVDPITLSALLSVCGVMDDIIWGAAVHGLVHKLGNAFRSWEIYGNAKLFKEMPEKDSISWNSLIGGYAQYGEYVKALKVFLKMLQRQVRANHVTFTSALASCSGHEFIAEAKILHALKMMRKAERVFERMPERDLVTWNTLIGGYADCEETDQAIKVSS